MAVAGATTASPSYQRNAELRGPSFEGGPRASEAQTRERAGECDRGGLARPLGGDDAADHEGAADDEPQRHRLVQEHRSEGHR